MKATLSNTFQTSPDEPVLQLDHGTDSDSKHEQACSIQHSQQLRGLLLEGFNSPPAQPADFLYFEGLRRRVERHTA
ncbi:MAG: type II toxin-antitoxin system ParD family antitoxin [Thiobacillus sp.]|jgi:hypothetical protein|nr:type II toxin-antitoxin system ParD family antitoxin [Thiobacillus sp.]